MINYMNVYQKGLGLNAVRAKYIYITSVIKTLVFIQILQGILISRTKGN